MVIQSGWSTSRCLKNYSAISNTAKTERQHKIIKPHRTQQMQVSVGLKAGDLEGIVEIRLSIDQYKSKMGDD